MRGLKDVRLKSYDYKSDGYYFVTVVCNNRRPLFENKKDSVESDLCDTVLKISGVELDYFVMMDNHVHIIFVLRNSMMQLGDIVRRFKAKVSHALNVPVWQPNYYEHVIRNELALTRIREYIVNNPQAEEIEFEQFYK